MSGEVLREAAASMRGRAEAALAENDWRRAIAKIGRLTPKGRHMSAWHPTVALAVADWLEAEALWWEYGNSDFGSLNAALAVARAYLGESA